MGTGYNLHCRKCGYEISANLGVGFLFPRAYQEAMEAARAGAYGERIQKFLEEHPDGALNAEIVLLQCEECGVLEPGLDLSMYVRNPEVPREKQGIWCVGAPFEGADYVSPMELEEKETYRFFDYGHYCEKCGKPMKSITQNNLEKENTVRGKNQECTVVVCPRCGENLWIDGIIMWD